MIGYHAVAVPPRLYSGCTARQGQDNRMLHNALRFIIPSLAPIYINTPGEVDHQVTHTVYSPHLIDR